MAWVTPKTNWVNGEYFNYSPDYERIKGNIEYLIELSKEIYPDYAHAPLDNLIVGEFPTTMNFTSIITLTRRIMEACYSPKGTLTMRSVVANAEFWNAAELNAIEGNHLRIYQALTGQKEGIRRLSYTLGGAKFGS